MIQFNSVTKSFSSVRAVDGLDFDVKPGEIFALLGPNGAGKTSSVRMIMGLMKPDSGLITFASELMDDDQVDRRRLGYLPEERGLYQEASVTAILRYLAALRGCRGRDTESRIQQWLERVDLTERAEEKVSSLSKGNQQKVQFIASILHQPRLAILDEPFAGLDPINQERMCAWIRELRDEGMTIMLSAHQLQLIEQIADRILLLHRGRRRLCGTLAEIRSATRAATRLKVRYEGPVEVQHLESVVGIDTLTQPVEDCVEIVLAEGAELNDVLTALSSAGRLQGLETLTPSLHDIFISRFDQPEARA
jgi:ABC-2 type transport system ATP-binding protein